MDYNPELFRKLIEKEMNGMKKKDFAALCGIAPETLYRYLADTNPKRPSKTVLRKIADRTSLSYKELCNACDYKDPLAKYQMDADERALHAVQNIKEAMDKMISGVHAYSSLSDFLDDYHMLYSEEDVEYSYSEKEEYEGKWVKNCDFYSSVCIKFKVKEGICKIWFVLYYYVTVSGKIIITGFDTSGRALMEAGVIDSVACDSLEEDGIDPKEMPYLYQVKHIGFEKRLFDAIFGNDMIEYLSAVKGFGFAVNETPPKFLSFMEKHKDTFCIGEQENKAFLELMNGGDPEQVFKDYRNPVTYNTGVGAAIAMIMRAETELEFEWLTGENGSDSCVLLPSEYDDYSVKELRQIVYPYAKELGLHQFGECYVTVKDYLDSKAIFTV